MSLPNEITHNSTPAEHTIFLRGGSGHGGFEIIPPISAVNYDALMQEPRLRWVNDFYLERDEDKDYYWRDNDYDGRKDYGAYYARAKYFASVVEHILKKNGAKVNIAIDAAFEEESNRRLYRIQATST